MKIYAKITPAIPKEAGYEVTFDEFPNVNTCGDSLEHAIEMASEALSLYLEELIDENGTLPVLINHEDSIDYYQIPIDPKVIEHFNNLALLKEYAQITMKISRIASHKLEVQGIKDGVKYPELFMSDEELLAFQEKVLFEMGNEGTQLKLKREELIKKINLMDAQE